MEKITDQMVDEMITLCSKTEAFGIKTLTVEPAALVRMAQEIKTLRESQEGSTVKILTKVRGYGWDECAETMAHLPSVKQAMLDANPYRVK